MTVILLFYCVNKISGIHVCQETPYSVLPVWFIHLHGHKFLQLRKGKHNSQVEFFLYSSLRFGKSVAYVKGRIVILESLWQNMMHVVPVVCFDLYS